MIYISVEDAAKKWNVSERSVRNYCAIGKIHGTILAGKTWKIPETAGTCPLAAASHARTSIRRIDGSRKHIPAMKPPRVRNPRLRCTAGERSVRQNDRKVVVTRRNTFIARAPKSARCRCRGNHWPPAVARRSGPHGTAGRNSAATRPRPGTGHRGPCNG